MSSLRRRAAGFSLVEIAIAIGIASFALIALLGLITVGYQAGGDAKEETLLAGLAQDVLGQLRGEDFDTLAPGTFYFDSQGNAMTNDSGAVYRCTTRFAAVNLPNVQSNLTAATLTFEWPVGAQTPQKMVIQASLARHE